MSTHNRIPDDQTIERLVFDVLREQWGPPLLEWFKERLLSKPRRELQNMDKIIEMCGAMVTMPVILP